MKAKIRWFYAGWILFWSIVGLCATILPLGADLSKANTGIPLWIFRLSQFMLLLGFGVFAFRAEMRTKKPRADAAPETDKEKAWVSDCGKKKRKVG